MKNYIKPEVKVYEVRIESLLTGSEDGQIESSFAPKRDFSLFDEENDDGYNTGSGGLWDDEDFED